MSDAIKAIAIALVLVAGISGNGAKAPRHVEECKVVLHVIRRA